MKVVIETRFVPKCDVYVFIKTLVRRLGMHGLGSANGGAESCYAIQTTRSI
jgi:hypothetical protein